MAEADREYERQEALRIKREKANAAARARYWKPENVAKRRREKAERRAREAEAARHDQVDGRTRLGFLPLPGPRRRCGGSRPRWSISRTAR